MDGVRLWNEVLDEADRMDRAYFVQAEVVESHSDGSATVRSLDPDSSLEPWKVRVAYGLILLPGDTIATVPIGGRHTAILIVDRP